MTFLKGKSGTYLINLNTLNFSRQSKYLSKPPMLKEKKEPPIIN
jgi:hypothetical protein